MAQSRFLAIEAVAAVYRGGVAATVPASAHSGRGGSGRGRRRGGDHRGNGGAEDYGVTPMYNGPGTLKKVKKPRRPRTRESDVQVDMNRREIDGQADSKKILGLLNKLTPENFDKLSNQIITIEFLSINSAILTAIFDRVILGPLNARRGGFLCGSGPAVPVLEHRSLSASHGGAVTVFKPTEVQTRISRCVPRYLRGIMQMATFRLLVNE